MSMGAHLDPANCVPANLLLLLVLHDPVYQRLEPCGLFLTRAFAE